MPHLFLLRPGSANDCGVGRSECRSDLFRAARLRAWRKKVGALLALPPVVMLAGAAALAAPLRGPEYVEYQAPVEIHHRFMAGALLVCTGLIFGGLLLASGRRVSGAMLGGLTIGAGLVLVLSRRFGLF